MYRSYPGTKDAYKQKIFHPEAKSPQGKIDRVNYLLFYSREIARLQNYAEDKIKQSFRFCRNVCGYNFLRGRI